MKIYDSYLKRKVNFSPIKENEVSMYVCGPTVYSKIHIGNARPIIFFKVVRNIFEYLGYNVRYISNITDIDDKIIKKAIQMDISESELVERTIKKYKEDCKALNCPVDYETPRVTEYMPQIVNVIKKMVDNGEAYVVDNEVFFAVDSIASYGQLSGQVLENLVQNGRVKPNPKKRNPLDFVLWKDTNIGVKYDSPFGQGRPGWHTECVAMIDSIFDSQMIDIHAGGSDLLFPHHENEIAQSLALNDHKIANYWLHNGRLNIDAEKMSKSIGNVISVDEVLKKYDVNAFKLFMLNSHYRNNINYTTESIEENAQHIERLKKAITDSYFLTRDKKFESKIDDSEIINCITDDFNTPNLITYMLKVLKDINTSIRQKNVDLTLVNRQIIFTILDILQINLDLKPISTEDFALYDKWLEARANKNFDEADKIRVTLSAKGLV